MKLPGKRIRRTRLVQAGRYVVDVEMVIPPDDPTEPCYEAETVQLLREVSERAERRDRESLHQKRKVDERVVTN